VSPLGRAYAALANGFPNQVIPVPPYVPDPTPAYFSDSFSSGTIAAPWMIKAGKWALEQGALRQSRVGYPWAGETCVLQYLYGDFNAKLKMRVNNAADPNNWAGFLFHAAGRFHYHGSSGYLVFMRRNGAIGLYNKTDGTVQEVANAVPDATQWQDIRVQMTGWHIQVWANGNLIIDRTDANHRFAQGYTILQVNKTDCSFDDLQIWTAPNAAPAVVSNTISATRITADDVTPYSVTITAADTDGVADLTHMQVVLDDGTFATDHARGRLAWGVSDEEIAYEGGTWTFMGDANGGGRWAWRLNDWGSDMYVTPRSATTTVDGSGHRHVTFTFTVKPAWATAVDQRLRGYVRDAKGDAAPWTLAPESYAIHRSAPGDFDFDGDVDQADFGIFQLCLSGMGIAQTDPTCAEARLDADNDVDQSDFAVFLRCMSGTSVRADPNCAN
jgi:hypothetical protein